MRARSAHIRLTSALGVAAVLTAASGLTTALVTSAQAATYPKLAGKTTSGNVFYGNYNGTGSEKWMCGDPSLGGTYILQPSDGSTSFGAIKTATSWKTKNGSAMSAKDVRTLAYVLAVDSDTTNDTDAARANWAVRHLVGNGSARATPGGDAHAAKGKQIIEAAKKLAGPYTSDLKLTRADGRKDVVYVENYRVDSASGKPLPGVRGTVKISGPGRFASNDGKSINTRSDGARLRINATGNGSITVTVTYTDLPATKVHYRTPASSAFQRMLVVGKTEKFDDSAKITLRVPPEPTPTTPPAPTASVTTQSSKNTARPGDQITDRIVVKASTPTPYTGTVTGGLYVTGSNPPEPVGDPVQWTLNGPGTYTSPPVQIPADAHAGNTYTWRWNFPAYSHATGSIAAFRTADNVPAETVTVDTNYTPAITTRMSDANASPGQEVTDQIWLSDVLHIPAGHDSEGQPTPARGWAGTISAALYAWPVENVADAEPVATVTVDVDSTDDERWETKPDGSRSVKADAPYVTPPVRIPADAKPASQYTWVITVDRWEDPDGGVQNRVTTPAGLPEETTTLPKATPTYQTQVSDQTATLGSYVTDAVTVTGMYAGEPITMNWQLFGPYQDRPSVGETCEGEPYASGQMTIDADGHYVTEPVQVDEPGYFTYVEWHEATDVYQAHATECGLQSETTLVKAQPELTTEISNTQTFPGSLVSDNITVTGLEADQGVQITWQLYGPYPTMPPLADTCEGDPLASGQVTATKNGTITTPDVRVPEAGYYTYRAFSDATKTYHAYATKCGEVAETTVAHAQPTYVTKVSDQRIRVGHTVTDTITVSGMAKDSTLRIHWELFGPYDTKPQPPDPDSEVPGRCRGKPLAHGYVTATGNGDVTTPPVKIERPGWYTYVESNDDQGINLRHETPCGLASETFLATKPDEPVVSVPAGAWKRADVVGPMSMLLAGVFAAGLGVGRRGAKP